MACLLTDDYDSFAAQWKELESMSISKSMKEAIELLKKEEFYLCDRGCSVWKAYGLSQTIHTKTMKALEARGVVQIELAMLRNADYVARLIDPLYEEFTPSEYCLHCPESHEVSMGRYVCRKTHRIVIGTDGRATVNAMKCR